MRIGLDMDDVVANLLPVWMKRISDATGKDITAYNIRQWEFWRDFDLTMEETFKHLTPDIYKDVRPFPGAVEAVNALRLAGHEIVFISHCPPNTEMVKQLWLLQYGFLPQGQGIDSGHLIPTKDKSHVDVDVLVDDHVKNVETFHRLAYLMTRPHNSQLPCSRSRVNSLEEFATTIWQRPAIQCDARALADYHSVGGSDF